MICRLTRPEMRESLTYREVCRHRGKIQMNTPSIKIKCKVLCCHIFRFLGCFFFVCQLKYTHEMKRNAPKHSSHL